MTREPVAPQTVAANDQPTDAVPDRAADEPANQSQSEPVQTRAEPGETQRERDETQAEPDETQDAPDEIAGEPDTREGPYGPGSAAPTDDGSAPPGYPIKGNGGSKLYHTPRSPHYKRTNPEAWFATEEDAVAAGFRPPAGRH